jgi:hypothetical protein
VDVQVHNRLAGGLADVDPHVEAVRLVLAGQVVRGLAEGLPDLGDFLRRGVEEAGDMAPGNDQGVSGRDREAVADCEGQGRLATTCSGLGGQKGQAVCISDVRQS